MTRFTTLVQSHHPASCCTCCAALLCRQRCKNTCCPRQGLPAGAEMHWFLCITDSAFYVCTESIGQVPDSRCAPNGTRADRGDGPRLLQAQSCCKLHFWCCFHCALASLLPSSRSCMRLSSMHSSFHCCLKLDHLGGHESADSDFAISHLHHLQQEFPALHVHPVSLSAGKDSPSSSGIVNARLLLQMLPSLLSSPFLLACWPVQAVMIMLYTVAMC